MLDPQIILDYVNSQPIKAVKRLDIHKKTIEYNEKIIQHRKIETITGPEEYVRAYLLTKLCNELGYRLDRIEIEKEYTAGRPKSINPRIDVILRDGDNHPFLFIEAKRPEDYIRNKDATIEGQLFNLSNMDSGNVKYLVLYTVDTEKYQAISDEMIVIDKETYSTYDEWKDIRQYSNELPTRYGKAQKVPYVKGSDHDLKTNYTHQALDSLREDLHDVLWGGGGTDDNEIFSSLVNLILAKIQDEDEKENGEQYDFQSFSYVQDSGEQFESNRELFNRINRLYKSALKDKIHITDKDVLDRTDVINTQSFSLSKLKYTVQQLEGLSFVDGKNSLDGKDILGDFFEGIITQGFKQSKGQYFTHSNIVKFMILGVKADELAFDAINKNKEIPYLIDPSAGSGTFIIEYMRFITNLVKYENIDERGYNKNIGTSRSIDDRITSDWFYPTSRENKWAKDYIYACELNFSLGKATKVNMILHGDGSTNVFVQDGLAPFNSYEKSTAPNALQTEVEDSMYSHPHKDLKCNENFDLILTNPPFSVKLEQDTERNVRKQFLFGEKADSESLFIERWYQLLKPNGRFAAILPESIFDITSYKYIRLFLFKYFKIKAIVSLPELTFKPYTTTKTSILFAQKKTSKEIAHWNDIWSQASKKYNLLRTRVLNLIDVYNGDKDISTLPSIRDLNEDAIKNTLVAFLKDKYMLEADYSSSSIISKYIEDLKEISKVDNDTVDSFGHVNTWWVFSELTELLSVHEDYDIYFAEAEEVGYQRTSRTIKPRPNDLYNVDDQGRVTIDSENDDKILNFIRNIVWD